jgi:signal transduction histidine kinase
MPFASVLRVASWPAICVGGVLIGWLVGTGGIADRPWPAAVLGTAFGLAWCFAGLAAWGRRPENRTGLLMVCVGLAGFVSLLQFAGVSLLYTVGVLAGPLYMAVFVHLLLAFPSGGLDDRLSRVMVVAAYVDTTVVLWVSDLFEESGVARVRNLVLVHRDQEVADLLSGFSSGVGVLLLLGSVAVLVRRWRRATPPWRHAVAPVLWTGAVAAAVAGLLLVSTTAGEQSRLAQAGAVIVFASVPFAFQLGLWRSQLGRGAVADLVIELGGTPAPGGLRDALARALGDPSLAIAFWLPERSRYVDADGRPIELSVVDGARTATVIRRHGHRVAALLHDTSLLERPKLIEATCAAAGLALENERLQADLSARVVDLQASRARIVEAGDAARRRIERDLHDGCQQRLVSVSMALGLAESKLASDPAARRIVTDARTGLGAALEDLRELSQGIHPAVLTERGLRAALQELAYAAALPVELAVRLDGRLPGPVEAAAYFVVAEALANVMKHAAATQVRVVIDREDGHVVVDVRDDGVGGADAACGTGLRGLADRVEALAGTLAVDSAPASGTRLRAEIPCGS